MDNVTEALTARLALLDPANDEHWNQQGNVSMPFVNAGEGLSQVSAAAVADILPNGYNRANAHAAPSIQSEADASKEEAGELAPLRDDIDMVDPNDAIALLEAFAAIAESDRYRRNSHLQGLKLGYQTQQEAIKVHQTRLDARYASKK